MTPAITTESVTAIERLLMALQTNPLGTVLLLLLILAVAFAGWAWKKR